MLGPPASPRGDRHEALRASWLIAAHEQQAVAEVEHLSCLIDHLQAATPNRDGAAVSASWRSGAKAFERYRAARIPWLMTGPVKTDAEDIVELEASWKARWGDPADPVVKERIAAAQVAMAAEVKRLRNLARE